MERRHAEAELKHQRQEKRHGADTDAKQEAADHAGVKCLDLEEAKIDQGRRNRLRMAHIEKTEDDAERHKRERHGLRQQILSDGGEAEGEAGQTDTGQHEALQVERRQILLAKIADEACGEYDAENPDRDIDPKDPLPVDIGGDEAAERRSDHGTDHSRNGEPGEGRDELGLRHCAQNDEPADRHHHRPAHALDNAIQHEVEERVGEAACCRAKREDDDGGPEHGFRAELVRDPAAQGDKDGERQQVGGHRQFQRNRVFANIAGNRGKRGGDHGRVHLLHEERHGDDEGDEIAGHMAGSALSL